jgi:hypothetical protein
MNFIRNPGILLVGVLVLGGCKIGSDSPIVVPDGESRTGLMTMTSVSGNVSIGKYCTIEATSRTINGLVKVGAQSKVEDLSTINGSIQTDEGVNVDGNVESVTGSIKLNQTVVQRDVRTVNGDIELRNKSVVKGDIVIKNKIGVVTMRLRPVEIEVTGGSIIEGDVVVERNVDVRLILRDGGKVLGQVYGAEVIDENVVQLALDDD